MSIIIFSNLAKSESVGPVKRLIDLVSPKQISRAELGNDSSFAFSFWNRLKDFTVRVTFSCNGQTIFLFTSHKVGETTLGKQVLTCTEKQGA